MAEQHPNGTANEILLETTRFRVERVTWQDPAGVTQSRAVIRHPGAVTIIPMLDDQHVCLIRNHRMAVSGTLVELPAGTREPDEEPLETAIRELAEETGYRAKLMRPLHQFYLSPGILDESMQLFLATEIVPGATAREPGEQIQNLVVRWDQAMEMAMSGEIRDAKTLTGLFFYDRLRRKQAVE